MRRAALVLTLIAGCGVEHAEPPTYASSTAALTQVSSFGSNPGGLSMWVHVPASLPANPALVVALHGCAQSANAYANTGWNALGDQLGFIVLYPQTTSSGGCFQWFQGTQQSRTGAEVTSIISMVNHLKTSRNVDPNRVFVTGLSAGGAQAAILLATHPDVFKAGSIIAGLPFSCGTGCMGSPPDRTPQQWGDSVRGVPGTSSFPAPRVAIWHGTSDFTVVPANLTELVDQWTNVNGVDQTPESTLSIGPATRREYRSTSGETRVESWMIANMGHGTPVDPPQCGTAGAFILDVGLCSSRFSAEFFGLVASSVDGGVPVDGGAPVDAGSPFDAGSPGDAGVPRDGGTGSCQEFTGPNYTHLSTLRATSCNNGTADFCAVGSGDNLGAVTATTTIREVAPGYFERGSCAGGSGGGSAGGGTAGGGTAGGSTAGGSTAGGSAGGGTAGGGTAGGGTAGGGTAGGSTAGGGATMCVEYTAFNYEHLVAGRAQSCLTPSACAVGSGQDLGAFTDRSTIREVRPGYYELGTCGGGGGGAAGGGAAGGSVAGGSAGGVAGGNAAGGSVAGGAAGGSVAGGSAGGSVAGGSAGGSVAGGAAGGSVAGGSAGGSVAGGAAGGSAAGGSAGGNVAGGTAGGNTSGGPSAGGTAGGSSAGGAAGGGGTAGGRAGGSASAGGTAGGSVAGGAAGGTGGGGTTGLPGCASAPSSSVLALGMLLLLARGRARKARI